MARKLGLRFERFYLGSLYEESPKMADFRVFPKLVNMGIAGTLAGALCAKMLSGD